MPGQQAIRRENRGDVPQDAPAECRGLRRQTTTLSVREPEPSGAQLFPQGAVLVLEAVNDVTLLLVDPTCERESTNRKYDG